MTVDDDNVVPAVDSRSRSSYSPGLHLLNETDDRMRLDPVLGGFNLSSEFDNGGFGDSFFSFDDVPGEDAPVLGDLSVELARSAGGSWLATIDQPFQEENNAMRQK
jgi:hypothetical protein